MKIFLEVKFFYSSEKKVFSLETGDCIAFIQMDVINE